MSEQDIIYVDSNATTLIAPEVYAAMTPYLTTWYGNPSSPHPFGSDAAEVIADARKSIGDLIGADEDEIVFTSCGTEADNTAIMSALGHRKADVGLSRRRLSITPFSLCHVCGNAAGLLIFLG